MSTIRKTLRQTLALSPAIAMAALAVSLAEPAAAACRGHSCSSGHHSVSSSSSRRVAHLPTMPATHSPKHGRPHWQSTPSPMPVSPRNPNIMNTPSASMIRPHGPVTQGASYTRTSLQPSGPPAGEGGGRSDASSNRSPGGNNLQPPAKPSPNGELTAVTVCVTSRGSCSMQRDVGTACQCKDDQGHVYDGVVR